MKKRRIFTTAMALAMSATCLGAAACKGKGAAGEDNAQTLQIYIGNYGYGYEWLERSAEAFAELDWVKAKHGEIDVPTPMHNSEKEYSQTMILSGGAANEYDVMFSTASANAAVFDKDGSGNPYFEDLTSLLDEEVPGEGVTLKQKMKADILESEYVVEKTQVNDPNASKHLYGMPWVDGMMGLLYNESAIKDALGSSYWLPRTTSELVEFSEDLKASQSSKPKNQQISVYMFSAPNGYWNNVQKAWWAQYEGINGYHNYYRGYEDNEGSMGAGIFAQKGRLYSLQALESIIHESTGFSHEEVNALSFTESQALFMQRGGFMSPNGDWVENEMRAVAEENEYRDDVIKYMRIPVISQIVEKMDLYSGDKEADDDKLSAIVEQIDLDKSYSEAKATLTWLTEKDYNKVYEARFITARLGGHSAYVPAYATAKELAKDFLRYLATDDAIEIFMETTNGCATPYEFDTSKLGFELPAMHKSKLENVKTGYRMSPASSFPLQYYGGLRDFTKLNLVLEQAFTSTNESDRWTAQEIYEADITYFNNPSNWASITTKAGF